MQTFEELQKRLQIGKDAYAKVCDGIDASLKSLVSADPKQLKPAQALQKTYADLEAPRELAIGTQPDADEAPAEKKTNGKKPAK